MATSHDYGCFNTHMEKHVRHFSADNLFYSFNTYLYYSLAKYPIILGQTEYFKIYLTTGAELNLEVTASQLSPCSYLL